MKTMNVKKIIGIVAIFCIAFSATAQRSADNIFRKYKNDRGVMYMDLGGDFASFLDTEEEIKTEVESIKILIFSDGENMGEDDLKDLKASLRNDEYEQLIQANTKEGRVNLYVVDGDVDDHFSEIFGILQSDKYNVFVRLYGKIYFEDLGKIDMNMGKAGNFGDFFGGKK